MKKNAIFEDRNLEMCEKCIIFAENFGRFTKRIIFLRRKRNDGRVTMEEASNEHPLSTHSASIEHTFSIH